MLRCVGPFGTCVRAWLTLIPALELSNSGSRGPVRENPVGFVLIVFRVGTRTVFVHGFAKSERDNIGQDELVALKKLAAELLAWDDKTIARVVSSGVLVEMKRDEKTVP